ncbi:MAG: acylase [Oscillatoria sp. PMC 1068.18]|nr:acylase [Oscillatoria sp. PMC 1076.18]MEC4990418.1 acylase [Oscillatoria sp. PMC 1068.18]
MLQINRKFLQIFAITLTFILIFFFTLRVPSAEITTTEILWDTWGVPHIYGENNAALFKAFGWAQMQSHGNLILQLYGQARGRAAEYWGEKYLKSDRYVRRMGIPKRASLWYSQQSLEMQQYLDNFAAGINDYVAENPDKIKDDLEIVLPVSGVDILAHVQRVINFNFVTNPQQAGSNGWAISPAHSVSGKAMLLSNTHLPWSDVYLWYEAQLTTAQTNAYGVTFVGMPVLAIAFNDYLGWTLTVNTFDGADIYELTLADNGYLFDNNVLPFDTETQTLKIKQADGTFREEKLIIEHSIHGVIIEKNKQKAKALRIVGLDRPKVMSQFWSMVQATNLQEFEAALATLQLPMFNLLYADQSGQIFYLFNAQIPVKNTGNWNYWQKVIPGNTATTLWTKYHNYQDLPRLHNPASGWLQNTNDPPWTSTFPPELNAADYPAYFAPESLGKTGNIFRTQHLIKILLENQQITLEELIKEKFSTHLELADRVLDELIPAAKKLGDDLGKESAEILEKWDRQANADSRGAVLFALWVLSMPQKQLFATPWNPEFPLTTPDGIANLQKAVELLEGTAATIKLIYGSVAVSWGDVVRLEYQNQDLPASGAPGQLGSLQVLFLAPSSKGRYRSFGGDTYIAAIEFSEPIQAKVLNIYGNSTQPNSEHIGDQLSMYLAKKLRPVWRTREEIEAHLVSRQRFIEKIN